ncbi:MAG: efflux RND transporter periplasmic adaptor subunit [Dehalococcoidales bacterium]
MKKLKIIGAILVILSVVSLFAGCGSKTTSTVKTQTYSVQKGSLSESVTGTGNLALSRTEDLAFEMAGYVEEVLVTEGETVKQGQQLAKLDTSEWNKQLKTYKQTLETAQRSLSSKQQTLTTAQRAVTTAENNVTKAQRTVTQKEFAVSTAQIAVTSANNSLYDIQQVKKLQDEIDNANYTLQLAKSMMLGTENYAYWYSLYQNTYKTLHGDPEVPLDKGLLGDMKELLGGTSTTTSADVALQVAQKVNALDKANLDLEDAQIAVNDAIAAVATAQQAVDDARLAVTNDQLDVNDATSAVADAQSDLDEANGKSPIIIAPFDGFISSVKVAGGDEVYKGTVAMTIADANQFSAKILVTEDDIFSVKLGGNATVSLTALSDESFPALVTKISPTATVSSGVVNYSVTVNITSLVPITTTTTTQSTTTQIPAQSANRTAPSGIPTGTPPAMGTTGNISTPAVMPQATSATTSASSTSNQTVSLKDGLSATVSIISLQKSNILIIPSKAITRVSGNSTVQVVKGTSTETRVIQTGMTDGTYTEVTSGLTEGEQVVIKTTTSSSSSSSSSAKTVSTQQQLQSISGGGPSGGPPGGF